MNKFLLMFILIFFSAPVSANMSACLRTMDSDADLTRRNHREVDNLMESLFRSVDTRNMRDMEDIHDHCQFIMNTNYSQAKEAFVWLRQMHDDLAADLKRPKRRNKKVVEIK